MQTNSAGPVPAPAPDGTVPLILRPFQIVTVRLHRA